MISPLDSTTDLKNLELTRRARINDKNQRKIIALKLKKRMTSSIMKPLGRKRIKIKENLILTLAVALNNSSLRCNL